MAINVEYAPRGGGYSQSQSQRRNYRPEEDDEESINPYALSRREGAQISARLRSDRERLGQKQRQKYGDEYFRDTEAGFDIQEPVTVWQDEQNGVRTGKVLYRNLGKDPIGTGGFGSLGSGEKIVYDYGQTINPNDAADMGKLGQVLSRRGQNVMELSGDTFLSPEELEQKKYERDFGRKKRAARYEDMLRTDAEEAQYVLNTQRDADKAKLTATAALEKRKAEEEAKKRGLLGQAQGTQLAADLVGETGEMEPAQKASINKVRSAMAMLQDKFSRGEVDESTFASGMEQLQKRYEIVSKPIQKYSDIQYDEQGNPFQIDTRGQRVYKTPPSTPASRLQEYIERRKVVAAEMAAREGRISPQQALALADQAADNVYRYTGKEPSEQEIAAEIRRLQAAAGSLRQAPVITDPQQAMSLPSGTVFTDPNGVKRRVP